MRTVVVHYHIFKNAGSSIDQGLRETFGDAWTSCEGSHAHDVMRSSRLASFLCEHPQILAVSSHLARPPLPWEGCIPIVFVRHPVLRARSVYEFVRNDPSQPFHAALRERSFREFCGWCLRGEIGSVVAHNYQVIHLSGASFRSGHILDATAMHSDLEEAMQLIEQWGFVGIVELFAESLAAYNAKLARSPLNASLPVRRVNRSEPASTGAVENTDSLLETLRNDLGSDLYTSMLEINALDLQLYQFARQRLLASHPIRPCGSPAEAP